MGSRWAVFRNCLIFRSIQKDRRLLVGSRCKSRAATRCCRKTTTNIKRRRANALDSQCFKRNAGGHFGCWRTLQERDPSRLAIHNDDSLTNPVLLGSDDDVSVHFGNNNVLDHLAGFLVDNDNLGFARQLYTWGLFRLIHSNGLNLAVYVAIHHVKAHSQKALYT